ncbi:MAG: hemerythrin domain-containing protein [Polyangiaceae bacterium]
MTSEPTPEWITEIESEHSELRRYLETLESKLLATPANPVEWGVGVRETVDSIVLLLEKHFAREEAALSPDAAQGLFPELAAKLAVLNRHHPRLLAAFREAAGQAALPDLDAQKAAEVVRRLRDSIDAMREHELSETELFDLVRLPA